MGLVNDLNMIMESEKVEKVTSLFNGYCDNDFVYCVCNLDNNKLYSVCSCYEVAVINQKHIRHNTLLWRTTKTKAQEHFIKCLLIKNTKKLHKENKKLMSIESIEKIASSNKADTVLFSTTLAAIAIQQGKIRFNKMISNGEKNCKYFPFNNTATQQVKEYYFNRYLQCFGGC